MNKEIKTIYLIALKVAIEYFRGLNPNFDIKIGEYSATFKVNDKTHLNFEIFTIKDGLRLLSDSAFRITIEMNEDYYSSAIEKELISQIKDELAGYLYSVNSEVFFTYQEELSFIAKFKAE